MLHDQRVKYILITIEHLTSIDSLIESLESEGELWEVDEKDIKKINKINLRKTAKFIRMMINEKGYEEVKKEFSRRMIDTSFEEVQESQ